MFEIREIINDIEYNPLSISKQTPFTQAWFYGEWQKMAGRKVRRFEVKKDSEIIGFFQIIRYSLPFDQNMLYIPHGPVIKVTSDLPRSSENGAGKRQVISLDNNFLKIFRDKLLEVAKEENTIFVRFDFCLPDRSFSEGGADLSKFFKKVLPHAYHSSYFQPKFEWFIDLKKSEEEILGGMNPKTRYNIGLAEKRGIEIDIIGENFEKYFNDFNKLLKETAKRDNFNLHPKAYYQIIFETLDFKNSFLVVAGYEGKILLVNLVLLYGRVAYFAFGGSSGEHKNLMFSHLAQWEAIKEAKRRGFEVYNFGGIGNGGKELEGVSFFKKRFGGELLEYFDSYDLVLQPLWYKLYNLRKWVLNLK